MNRSQPVPTGIGSKRGRLLRISTFGPRQAISRAVVLARSYDAKSCWTRRATGRRPEWSGRDAVAEVNDAVAESVLVEELEVGADARRERRLATAEDHGPNEEPALVDQAGFEGPSGEVRPADGEVRGGFGLQLLDGFGVEAAFEACGRG